MVTVISYRGGDYAYNINSAFSGRDVEVFKKRATIAMLAADAETRLSFISVETFSDNGDSEDIEVFADVESAIKWWVTK